MSPPRPGYQSGEGVEIQEWAHLDQDATQEKRVKIQEWAQLDRGASQEKSRRGGVMKDWYDGLSSQNLDFLNLEFQNYFKVWYAQNFRECLS